VRIEHISANRRRRLIRDATADRAAFLSVPHTDLRSVLQNGPGFTSQGQIFLQTPRSRAGWPGFLCVELFRSILFRSPAQNVETPKPPPALRFHLTAKRNLNLAKSQPHSVTAESSSLTSPSQGSPVRSAAPVMRTPPSLPGLRHPKPPWVRLRSPDP